MCWNVYKLSLIITLFFSFITILGCDNKSQQQKKESSSTSKESILSFRDKIVRAVETELEINAAEEYDIQIKKEYINPDTLQDALILVNRKQWAHERAAKSGNQSFVEKTGYVGPNNYVFVKLGGTDKLIKTPPVGSSADHPLESRFLTLTSQAHKDFYVNYRIRNSLHRNYYSIRKNRMYLTFSCPIFDSIGEQDPRVFAIKHQESTVRISKDIAMYEGKIVGYNPSQIEDVNSYKPRQIIPTDQLYVYFIFDESSMKYKTPMVPKEDN
jgi:hypothetical protein